MKNRTIIKNQKGFTLIELISVILILAVIGTIVVKKYIGFTDSAIKKTQNYESKAIERYNVVKDTGFITSKEGDSND